MPGIINAVSCQPILVPDDPPVFLFLCGRWNGVSTKVHPECFDNCADAWGVASKSRMHVIKATCRGETVNFEPYLHNPDGDDICNKVIQFGLSSLLSTVRLHQSRKVPS